MAATPVTNGASAPSWQILLMAMAIIISTLVSAISGIGALLNPRGDVQQARADLMAQIAQLKSDLENENKRLREEQDKRETTELHNQYASGVETRLRDIEEELKLDRGTVVRRTELEGRLKPLDDRVTTLRQALASMQGNQNIGTAVERLQNRFDEFQNRITVPLGAKP